MKAIRIAPLAVTLSFTLVQILVPNIYSSSARGNVSARQQAELPPMRLIFGIATNMGARSFMTQVGAHGIEEPVEMPYKFVDGEFSPDGRSIAFENCGEMGNKSAFGIYVVKLVDRTSSLVAPMTGKTCTCVRWAPEGERLSFADPANRRLHIIKLASKEVISLPHAEVGQQHWWSPGGDEIVFDRGNGGKRELFITDLQGEVRQLTHLKDFNNGESWAPTWSRDGSRIAFIVSGEGFYTVAPDGSDLKSLEGTSRGYEPRWSTDGEWLLFKKGDQLMQIRKDGMGLKVTGQLPRIASSFSLN
jgi:Tol biopolymer transport system component